MPDAERESSLVHPCQIAVAQVGHDRLLAAVEDLLRDLAAGVETRARERYLAPHPGQLELELTVGAGEHDESAFGIGDVDRRIQHQREHLVEHARAAERLQRLEQRGDLPEASDGGPLAARGRLVADEKPYFDAAAPPEADVVAV